MQCNHYGCSEQAELGRKQCRPHLNSAKDYQLARRVKLLKEGKCTRCTNPSRPGKTMCQTCADKWNEYLRGRRAGKVDG